MNKSFITCEMLSSCCFLNDSPRCELRASGEKCSLIDLSVEQLERARFDEKTLRAALDRAVQQEARRGAVSADIARATRDARRERWAPHRPHLPSRNAALRRVPKIGQWLQ